MQPAHDRPRVVVAFDQHAGQLRHDDAGRLVGIDLLPDARDALEALGKQGAQVALLVDGVGKAVDWALDDKHVVRVIDARGLEQVEHALGASIKGAHFVSADRRRRGEAKRRGLLPAPHLQCVRWALAGEHIRLVEIEGPRAHVERLKGVLPYRFEVLGDQGVRLLGLQTRKGFFEAVARKLCVRELPFDPAVEDLLLVKLDAPAERRRGLGKAHVLRLRADEALLALGPDVDQDALELHGAHGHYEWLGPDPGLLRPARFSGDANEHAALLHRWGIADLAVVHIDPRTLDLDLHLWTCPTTAAALEQDVRRYTGGIDPGGGVLRSRHTAHPDNTRAVDLLVADLAGMGYCVQRFAFASGGRTLYNVIADLPGRGTLTVDPSIRDKLREILRRHPPWPPEPDPPWRAEIEKLLPRNGFMGPDAETRPTSLHVLERLYDLRPWRPWWLRCLLDGIGAGLVLVGCHLDSTAGSDGGYDPATGAAPGVDDDASGIAATLAIARHLAGRRGDFRHTIRFCFFNAEEQGLVGSKAYAAWLKAQDAPVRAVVCMDMIGFNSDANRIFEVHAGYTDPVVRDASRPIADRIANWASALGIPGPAQVYAGTSSSGGSDRNLVDGAINRSDHAAFHQQGYPAVVVSEDFFVNLASEPTADPNPNYHRAADTTMDFGYASQIACVVAQTVKALAQ